MKYIREIFQYFLGRPMNRYEEDYEIIISELISILIVSAIVICSVYLLITIK